jgi:ATP synthase protein I
MTTETRQDARRTGVSTLVRASAAAAVIGLAIALVALVVAGGAGFLAAMIGAVVVVAVLFSGALVVTVVADLMPAASLLVALMTYTLQMALLALVLIPLSRTEWSSRELDAPWLAAAVIGGALVWTVAQVVLATRARIPVYDLPVEDPARTPRQGVSAAAEGGAR